MSFDTKAFRHALGSFPTGVAVVTAAVESEPVGITVNSFTSVSLDPPLVLWCLKKDSNRYRVFIEAKGFTISVLGTEHENVSVRLARQGVHRLNPSPRWTTIVRSPMRTRCSNAHVKRSMMAAITPS